MDVRPYRGRDSQIEVGSKAKPSRIAVICCLLAGTVLGLALVPPAPGQARRFRRTTARGQYARHSRTPRVNGHFVTSGGTQLSYRSLVAPPVKPFPLVDTPPGGGTARLNIADNNKAFPEDRIYFMFNHFENALQVQVRDALGVSREQFSVSRYTLGFEKTLLCDCQSLEIRVPVTGTYQFFSSDFGVAGENAGNISLIFKQLIAADETFSSVVGLGVNLPTGTDIRGNVSSIGYQIQNETVHLLPYTGFLWAPTDSVFFHGFLHGDFVANGNPVFATPDGAAGPALLGRLTGQNLAYFTTAAGVWLHQDPDAYFLTGLATIAELHYVTTLQDADELAGVVDTTLLEFGNSLNHVDVLNCTFGLHFELGMDTTLRVASAFPLREDPDRNFDAEVLVQLNYHF